MYKYVRIIDSKLPTYWYSSMIGKVYKVSGNDYGDDWVMEEGPWPDNVEPTAGRAFISKSDCVVINSPKDYNGDGMKHRFI